MGMLLNPGNAGHQISLNSPILVDKSGIIGNLNRVLGTRDRFVCVSRPRRFGKTMTADMLLAYYGRTVDSRAQFAGTTIEADETFEVHLNRYNGCTWTCAGGSPKAATRWRGCSR